MVFHTARFATEKQVRPPACRKCFQRADEKVGGNMLKLEKAYATEVYESDAGYIVISQGDDDSREALVLLTKGQAELVAEELLRLAKQQEAAPDQIRIEVLNNQMGCNHA